MKQSTIALALLPLLFTPVTKARTPEMPVLENRAAQGDITAPGGARRLTGDQTAALRDSLSDKPAKNIILLIGDGMGDSEITAARNYAEGAGGFGLCLPQTPGNTNSRKKRIISLHHRG